MLQFETCPMYLIPILLVLITKTNYILATGILSCKTEVKIFVIPTSQRIKADKLNERNFKSLKVRCFINAEYLHYYHFYYAADMRMQFFCVFLLAISPQGNGFEKQVELFHDQTTQKKSVSENHNFENRGCKLILSQIP